VDVARYKQAWPEPLSSFPQLRASIPAVQNTSHGAVAQKDVDGREGGDRVVVRVWGCHGPEKLRAEDRHVGVADDYRYCGAHEVSGVA
jgi:hypothetical protein